MAPSHKAVVFVDNHDNQRGHGGAGDVLTHKTVRERERERERERDREREIERERVMNVIL